MDLVEEPKRPGVFTFMWSIYNFSRCMRKANESLNSPTFYVGIYEMQLSLYPKGYDSTSFMSLYLDMLNSENVRNYTFVSVLSLKRCNGIFEDSNEISVSPHTYRKGRCQNFISIGELNEHDAYLENDKLTVRCRVWRRNASVLEPSVDCFAKTKIKIAKLNYLWILENLMGSDGILKHKFERSTGILKFSSEFPTIKIHVSTGEAFDDDFIYLAIERQHGSNFPLFFVYNIHLLDSNGSIAHFIRGEALLQSSGEIQKFPFLSKRKLLSNKDLYLSGKKLSVKCEFSFSGNHEVEIVEFGTSSEPKFNLVKSANDSVSDGHELWKFYSDGEFSDLLVCTNNQEFRVHRAILCAQSEVFRRMLNHDMKEKNTAVFTITDFEDDTVSKLLLYLYTNALDDTNYALVKNLYFAADKYQITPLQKICSNRLIGSIDASNVCDILPLADQLRDQELKSAARDFIASNPYEIMNSGGWKNLMETNPHLTSHTMQWMIFNNFLSYK